MTVSVVVGERPTEEQLAKISGGGGDDAGDGSADRRRSRRRRRSACRSRR